MSISLRSMRYLTTALRQQSISKAAQELSVAASAVSAAIDQIEDELQLKLVNRVRARGISATANGRVMERKFVHLLEEYEAVMAEGSDLRQAMTGVLRIGYYAPVAPAFLPAILAPLSELGSGITYHLAEDDNDRVQEGLLAGDYDAIIFGTPTRFGNMAAQMRNFLDQTGGLNSSHQRIEIVRSHCRIDNIGVGHGSWLTRGGRKRIGRRTACAKHQDSQKSNGSFHHETVSS